MYEKSRVETVRLAAATMVGKMNRLEGDVERLQRLAVDPSLDEDGRLQVRGAVRVLEDEAGGILQEWQNLRERFGGSPLLPGDTVERVSLATAAIAEVAGILENLAVGRHSWRPSPVPNSLPPLSQRTSTPLASLPPPLPPAPHNPLLPPPASGERGGTPTGGGQAAPQARTLVYEKSRVETVRLAAATMVGKMNRLEGDVERLQRLAVDPSLDEDGRLQVRGAVRVLEDEAGGILQEWQNLREKFGGSSLLPGDAVERVSLATAAIAEVARILEDLAVVRHSWRPPPVPNSLPPLSQRTSTPLASLPPSLPLAPHNPLLPPSASQSCSHQCSGTPGSCMAGAPVRAHIERMKLPRFSGKAEDYWEFRECFHTLVKDAYPEPALYLLQLKQHLDSREAQNLLRGMTVVQEAWNTLDQHFGDEDAAINTVLANLRRLKLSGNSPHDRLESLAQAVHQAKTSLQQVDAGDALDHDKSLIGTLVTKLPSAYSDRWFQQVSETGGRITWQLFSLWLKKARGMARAARNCELNSRLSDPKAGGAGLGAGAITASSQHPGGKKKVDQADRAGDGTFLGDPAVAAVASVEAMKRALPCPICAEEGVPSIIHTYWKKFPSWPKPDSLEFPSNWITACPRFSPKTPAERADIVSRHQVCVRCSSYTHSQVDCRRKAPTCTATAADGVECGERHLTALHECGAAEVLTMGVSLAPPGLVASLLSNPICTFTTNQVFLAIARVPCSRSTGDALLLADEGSQVTLVRHDWALQHGAGPGIPWTLNIQVVGERFRPLPTRLYEIFLCDSEGKEQAMVAAGVERISTVTPSPDLTAARKVFPDILTTTLRRPDGEVDILLGSCDARLMPFGGKKVGNLRLEKTPWGSGEVLRGSHPSLPSGGCLHLSAEALTVSRALLVKPEGGLEFPGLTTAHICTGPQGPDPGDLGQVLEDGAVAPQLPNFWEGEELGAAPRAGCSKHRDCQDCRNSLEHLSPREREALALLDSGITVKDGVIRVRYPFLPCVTRMRDNIGQARAVQGSVEKSLIAKGLLGQFNGEMEKAFRQGTFSLVSQGELAERRQSGAPMNYIAVFGIIQAGHVGHTLRVVANCKMKNVHSGLSVNDCVENTPKAMVPLLEVLLWWRTNLYVVTTDLHRAYQALHTGPEERFLRLFLWRRSPREPWCTYGYDRVTFGDRPAAAALELAKERAADRGHHIHPATADQLRRKLYVDDGALRASSREELLQMKGSRRVDGTYDGYISRILATCRMAPKFIAIAGDPGPGEEELIGGAFMGVGYNCGRDQVSFSFPMVYHKKGRGGSKTEMNMTVTEVRRLKQGLGTFSLRTALSYLMGLYDPLGLTSPLNMRGKLLLRQTHAAAGGWDQELPNDIKKEWGHYILELKEAGTVFFPRSTVPPRAGAPDPIVIGFGDGSMQGFAAVVYVVWTFQDRGSEVYLVMAKARVAPVAGTTVPRMEMSSATLAARITLLVVRGAGFRTKEVVIALDSECSVAALQKRDGLLKPYFAHRAVEVAEARQELGRLCPVVGEVVAVSGSQNPADIATRGRAAPVDISPTSRWQQGERWMKDPRHTWPLKTEVCEGAIPEDERRSHQLSCSMTSLRLAPAPAATEVSATTHHLVKRLLLVALDTMNLSNNLDKTTRILAMVMRSIISEERRLVTETVTAGEFRAARALQYLAAAPASLSALSRGDLRSLGAIRRCGEVWIQGRVAPDDMASVLGVRRLRVIMPSTRLAQLIMTAAHEEDHRRDPKDSMARARRSCWIPRGRALAQRVISSCPACRREHKKVVQQEMGDLPKEKSLELAPFEAVGCDFMGPYMCSGMCGGRRNFKVWVTVYTCLASHATVLLATPGYDAKTFVTSHSRFCNTYSAPNLIIVDHGPNLVAAAERPDWQEVARTSGWGNTTWKITPKGCPWRAGQVERTVGMAKTTMHRLLAGRAFSGNFHQFEELLARIAWLLNSRPVATHAQTETDFYLVTPNDIILGRAARPRGEVLSLEDMEEPGLTLKTLSHMEKVARQWHASYIKQVWPLLVPRNKWKDRKENVQVGDIGFLLYTSKFGKPTWRACRVLATHPDRAGVVHTVTVGLRLRSPGHTSPKYKPSPLYEMIIGVQRMAVTIPIAEQKEVAGVDPRDPSQVCEEEVVDPLVITPGEERPSSAGNGDPGQVMEEEVVDPGDTGRPAPAAEEQVVDQGDLGQVREEEVVDLLATTPGEDRSSSAETTVEKVKGQVSQGGLMEISKDGSRQSRRIKKMVPEYDMLS